jgi:predicted small secreted protein
MKRILTITFVALQILAVGGCSTMNGMGQDISDTWHSITGSDGGH